MAFKDAVKNVLEKTRALADSQESEKSFEEKMELLKESVRVLLWWSLIYEYCILSSKPFLQRECIACHLFFYCVSCVDARVENRRL